jgi:hypothetical protein
MTAAALMAELVSISSLTWTSMAESMSSGDIESTVMADAGPPNHVDAMRLSMMGEGGSESIDPDPVVPTVGAN